jgi:acyl transferase domain-containing protein
MTNGYIYEPEKLDRHMLVLSAKDESSVMRMALNLSDYLSQKNDLENDQDYIKNLAHTLYSRRSHFPWRVTANSTSVTDFSKVLGSGELKAIKADDVPRLGFIFTGQGAQWWAMGRELIETYPVFKQSLMEAEQIVREFGAPWSLIEELTRDEASSRINESEISLPLCVAVQVSLVDLLRSWGIYPTAVCSHSSGEATAAYCAGVLDKKSAIATLYYRGTLTETLIKSGKR